MILFFLTCCLLLLPCAAFCNVCCIAAVPAEAVAARGILVPVGPRAIATQASAAAGGAGYASSREIYESEDGGSIGYGAGEGLTGTVVENPWYGMVQNPGYNEAHREDGPTGIVVENPRYNRAAEEHIYGCRDATVVYTDPISYHETSGFVDTGFASYTSSRFVTPRQSSHDLYGTLPQRPLHVSPPYSPGPAYPIPTLYRGPSYDTIVQSRVEEMDSDDAQSDMSGFYGGRVSGDGVSYAHA